MAPKPLSKKANHSPCRRLSKVILNSHEKKKFLLKLKEKVTKKKFLNHLITAQNKSIEVITLDDDNEMEVCENVPNMAEKTVEKPAKATVKTATLSSSRRLPVTPFLGLADYIKVCDKPLRLASSAKFGSFESLSNSSSNDSNNDRNLEVQVLPGVDGEISIIETENDDELSVSFFDKDSAKEKDADDVAIVKHIQCDLDARQTIALKKVGHGIVYIDGSCREFYPTGELIAGIGVYWGENDKRNVSQLIHGQVSSNRAEIQAAVRAIATAIEFRYEYVTVYTDSIYLIEGIKRYMRRLMSYTERCRPDFAQLAPLLQKIKVVFKKVPAHKGIRGNEFADELATQATRRKIQEMHRQKRNQGRRY